MALNSREKMLLGGLALVGVVLATYTFVHEPFTARRAEARQHLDQVENELVQEQKKLAREGDLEARRSEVTARENLIDSWVPGKNSAAMLVWHFSQAEKLSGARIRRIDVGTKELVTVDGKDELLLGQEQGQAKGQPAPKGPAQPAAPAQPSGEEETQAGTAEQPQAAAPNPAQPQSAQSQPGQAQPPAEAMSTLVMVPLQIQVDARFAEHLIFNQYLEDAPLFLNTHGIRLTRVGALPLEKVGKLVQVGNPWLAEQVLTESPPVDGIYKMALFFKATKAGPSTEEMQFDTAPGRIDPFVMAAVDEFIRVIEEYFADQGEGGGDNSLPDYGQLG